MSLHIHVKRERFVVRERSVVPGATRPPDCGVRRRIEPSSLLPPDGEDGDFAACNCNDNNDNDNNNNNNNNNNNGKKEPVVRFAGLSGRRGNDVGPAAGPGPARHRAPVPGQGPQRGGTRARAHMRERTHAHAHAHAHTRSHSYAQPHSRKRKRKRARTRARAHTHTQTHSLTHSPTFPSPPPPARPPFHRPPTHPPNHPPQTHPPTHPPLTHPHPQPHPPTQSPNRPPMANAEFTQGKFTPNLPKAFTRICQGDGSARDGPGGIRLRPARLTAAWRNSDCNIYAKRTIRGSRRDEAPGLRRQAPGE